MKKLFSIALLLLLLALPAQAADLGGAVGLDKLNGAAEEYLDGYLDIRDVTGEGFADGARAILDTGNGQLTGALRRAARSGVLLLAVALLCGLAETLKDELGGGGELAVPRVQDGPGPVGEALPRHVPDV